MIAINELSKISDTDLFLTHATRLSGFDSKEYIDYFNNERRERYGHTGVLPAEYFHEFHLIKNEWQRKILLVKVKDDTVLVVLKHVQMFENIYKRLEGLPISMSGNKDNENLVFDALTQNDLVKKILVIEPECEYIEQKGYALDTEFKTYNYYSHIPTNFGKISANKWMHKKGVKRLLKEEELTFERLNAPDPDIFKINKAFIKWKKEIEQSKWLSSTFSKAINDCKFWWHDGIDYYIFKYGNVPVGLIVYLVINENIAFQLVNKGIDHLLFEEDVDVPDEVRKRIGAYMHYLTMKDLFERGVIDCYAGGAMGTRKASLGVHKMIMNDSYFGVKIYGRSLGNT